jgi:G8 domain
MTWFTWTRALLVTFLGVMTVQPLVAQPKEKDAPAWIRSAKNGLWSAPATWEGDKVPAASARVQVRAGHTVTYDRNSDQAIRSIHVAGTLTFARDKNTRLDVGLIKIQAGDEASEEGFECDAHMAEVDTKRARPALEVGMPDAPIDAKYTATIRLVYFPAHDKQSCPAIVCCGGRWDMHGAPLGRSWVKLGDTVKPGDTSVTLAEVVPGWKVGDRVIVTATNHHEYGKRTTEERVIRSIDGTKVTLDTPLEYKHLGSGEFRGEVANLSRNVVVESADPKGERGHTMYHKNSAGSLSCAEFRHLGKEGVLGRYALHFHLIGDTMRGSSVIGCSIWDSANRWLTIHGTNYLVVRDNVGYQSIGHGFFFEDGTEVYNVLDRNLAVGAKRGKRLPKQVLGFDANDGAGFWWANSLNTFTRNVAVENGLYGYRYEATQTSALKLVMKIQQPDGTKKAVDIRTLPFVRFEDNEVHSTTGLYGVNLGEGVNRVGPDTKHPFIVRNLKIWDTHYGFRPQVPSLLVENLTLHHTHYGVYHPNYDNHVYRNVTISLSNTEPFNRGHDDLSVQFGSLTVDGLTFDNCRSGGMPLIQISDHNPSGAAVTHLRNVKTVNWTDNSRDRALVNLGGGPRPKPETEKGVPVYLHDWFGPGKDAMVVSVKSGEFKADPTKFHAEKFVTGDESRLAEVKGIPFPQLLDPVDDLPPTTVITHVRRQPGGKVLVRGTTADNGAVKRVVVNGKEAKAVTANFAEWEIVLTDVRQLIAHAEDAAGNIEKHGHVMVVR